MKYIIAMMLFSVVFASSVIPDDKRIHIEEPGPVLIVPEKLNIPNISTIYETIVPPAPPVPIDEDEIIYDDYNAIVPPAPPVPPPGPIDEDEIIYDTFDTNETDDDFFDDDLIEIDLVIVI